MEFQPQMELKPDKREQNEKSTLQLYKMTTCTTITIFLHIHMVLRTHARTDPHTHTYVHTYMHTAIHIKRFMVYI